MIPFHDRTNVFSHIWRNSEMGCLNRLVGKFQRKPLSLSPSSTQYQQKYIGLLECYPLTNLCLHSINGKCWSNLWFTKQNGNVINLTHHEWEIICKNMWELSQPKYERSNKQTWDINVSKMEISIDLIWSHHSQITNWCGSIKSNINKYWGF